MMTGKSQGINLPTDNIKNAIENIAKREKFVDYRVTVSSGSEKGDNFLGIIFRVKIEENGKSENKQPLHLIIKTPPDETMRNVIPINKFYGMEVYVYSVIFPALNTLQEYAKIPENQCFKLAKCFGCCSQNLLEFLALEDLNVRGFKMFDRLKSFDYEHMRLIVNKLANYHALSYAMKEKQPANFRQLSESVINSQKFTESSGNMFDESFARAVMVMKDPLIAERLKKFSVNLLGKLNDFLDNDGKDRTFNIITHGDCWCNNFVFNYEGEKPVDVIFLDWQLVRYASPITDLAYLIFTSTDEEFRGKYLENIMEEYHKALGLRLALLGCDVNKCYPVEIYKQHTKEKLLIGLLWSMVVIPLSSGSKEDVIDLGDIVGGNNRMGSNEVKISEVAVERMNGVVKDFIKFGMFQSGGSDSVIQHYFDFLGKSGRSLAQDLVFVGLNPS